MSVGWVLASVVCGPVGTHLVRCWVEGEQGAGPVLPSEGLITPVHILRGHPLQQRGQQRVRCQVL